MGPRNHEGGRVKKKAREILDAFLPAMAQIQATDESDEQKKRNAKEWLRSKLDLLIEEAEQNKDQRRDR
jgi:hypothetical protein